MHASLRNPARCLACEVREGSSTLSGKRGGGGIQHVVWHASWRRHSARCWVTPSREVYTTASRLSKMPTCTMTYTQDSHANPNEQLKTKLPPVPDVDDRRYCRACQCTLPLSAFPSGTRRFLCKRHIWQRIQQPSKRRALANNKHKKLLWTMWKKCWTDARKTFKRERILLLQRDIGQTLEQLEDSSNNTFNPNSNNNGCDSDCQEFKEDPQHHPQHHPQHQELIRDSTAAFHKSDNPKSPSPPTAAPDVQITAKKTKDSELDLALMPCNPEHHVSRDNVVVVNRTARRVLLQAFRQGGAARYIAELRALG